MSSVAEWLLRLGAHHDVVTWAQPYERSWARAWAECPRGDWVLGIAARTAADPSALVRAASACARLAEVYLDGDERLRVSRALDVAEAWAVRRGPTTTLTELASSLERAAESAQSAGAASALRAAGAACRTAGAPETAPMAAVFAVEAAVQSAGDCAMLSALGFMQEKTADAVRTHVPRQLVKAPFADKDPR